MILIKSVKEKRPTKKATIIPRRPLWTSIPDPIFRDSKKVAPRMAGTERRKENLPESSRSSPQKSPVDMVAPDREIPGMMATPWAIPIRTESTHPIFSMSLLSFLAQRVSQSTKPVTRSITPTTLGLEKRDSNQSFNRIPMRPVGMVATTIQRKRFACGRPSRFPFSIVPIP